jgi:anti-sigma factor RsiW
MKMPDHNHEATQSENLRRFELLSAYIDGEVTPQERLQVQHWLDTEPKFQQLYVQLLRLQKDLDQIPIPPTDINLLTEKVFTNIDKRRNQRLVLLGSGIIAAITLGLTSLGGSRPSTQMAYQGDGGAEPLMIALNRPILEIPSFPENQPVRRR